MILFRITAVLKVETDMIIIIAASLIGTSCDTSDNICLDLQSWSYCFYLKKLITFDSKGVKQYTDNYCYLKEEKSDRDSKKFHQSIYIHR